MIKIKEENNTIREAVNAVISTKSGTVRDRTLQSYKNIFKCLEKYIDFDKEYNKSASEEFRRNVIQESLSSATVDTYFRHWNMIGDYKIKNVKHNKPIKDTYSDNDIKHMLKAPDKRNNFCAYRNWVIILLLLDSGARSGTIRAIKCSDIDINNRQIVCRHTKNGRSLVIYFGKYTEQQLRKYIKYRNGKDDDYLFCDAWGNELTESGLRQGVEKYLMSLGIKGTVHQFRHTFCKRMLLDGIDPFTLKSLLGHQTLTQTMNYCNLWDREVADRYRSNIDNNIRQKIKM